ncbi:MAG TPA: hypothetical protein VFW21_12655, partial [Mycobacterium sp.]|nr:hypothetical protein [Mycobacterium sp.]
MRLRRGPLSFLTTGVLAASFLSAVALPLSSSPAVAAPVSGSSGDEVSVPDRGIAPAPVQQQEDVGKPLPAPVWPVASDKPVALSGVAAGALVTGTPAGSVVSVGPAASGAVGPLQAKAQAGAKPGAPDGVPTGQSAPVSVDVRVVDRGVATAAGGQALGVILNRGDGSRSVGAARVRIDYSGFAFAYGGDFAGRLRLVELPACALSTPSADGCQSLTFVDAVNDTKAHTLTGTVDVNPDPAAAAAAGVPMLSGPTWGRMATSGDLLTVVPMTSSGAGDFKPTDFKASGAWDVSIGSGAFTYSVPVALPPPPVGKAPSLSWDYNSQTVDGMTSATNNQAAREGIGWSLTSSYIERRYRTCADDGSATPANGDLCWDSPYGGTDGGHAADGIYDIVLNGVSSVLVADPQVSGEYHLQDDPGWLVQHKTGAANGDTDGGGEWWQVMTPDGSLYYFGYGVDPKTGAATGSVLTEPVFGNNSGEPCHAQYPAPCQQAWRWMLDQVRDPNEVLTAYHYVKETNSYRSTLGTVMARSYDMGAWLNEIDYGYGLQLAGTPNYTDKVVLSYVGRCYTRVVVDDPLRNGSSNCPSITQTSDFPDVPLDKLCDPGTNAGCNTPLTSLSPVHFSLEMLWQINTFTIDNTGAASAVMRYQTRDGLADDGNGATLSMDYIQREAFGGTNLILPVINFDYVDGVKNNLVGSGSLNFRRISKV